MKFSTRIGELRRPFFCFIRRPAQLVFPCGLAGIRVKLVYNQNDMTMEIIGAFEAKTRLSELLARTENGEVFQITKHGRPVGKLTPPDTAPDHKAIAQAVQRLKAMSGIGGTMKSEELKAMIHEGHCF